MDAHPGEFVYATAGRDKGKCFVILSVESEYLYLADGRGRKVSTPKKKKVKHVEMTGEKDEFIYNKITQTGKVTNKEIRYSLSNYLGDQSNDEIKL